MITYLEHFYIEGPPLDVEAFEYSSGSGSSEQLNRTRTYKTADTVIIVLEYLSLKLLF